MVANTIMQKATQQERNYLLAFDAMELDTKLKDNLVRAYEAQDFSKATKLERISYRAQERLNRRYNDLFKKELVH
jgi:hypothetical protein